jgi:hypothetical protein
LFDIPTPFRRKQKPQNTILFLWYNLSKKTEVFAMRTITIKMDESIYDKFMTVIGLFPKSKLKITSDDKQKKLEALQNDIKKSFEDVKLGRVTKTGKTIQIKS